MTLKLPIYSRWRLLAVFALLLAYSAWYAGAGFYGQLGRIENFEGLQDRFYYSGAYVLDQLGIVQACCASIGYLAFLFDGPFMLLSAVLLTGVIGSGAKVLGFAGTPMARTFLWSPLLFLILDVLEDLVLAIILAGGPEVLSHGAGILTALKWTALSISLMLAFICGLGGAVAMLTRRLKV